MTVRRKCPKCGSSFVKMCHEWYPNHLLENVYRFTCFDCGCHEKFGPKEQTRVWK